MKGKYLLFILGILFSYQGFTQEEVEEEHHHHKNEISLAAGIVPLLAENKISAGFHFHYIRGLGPHRRFGLGLAAETIIDEHKHFTFSVVGQVRIWEGLIFAYAPGLLLRKETGVFEKQFAQHFELTYEFELEKFHIGPVIELGVEKNGIHFMGGVHFGIDF